MYPSEDTFLFELQQQVAGMRSVVADITDIGMLVSNLNLSHKSTESLDARQSQSSLSHTRSIGSLPSSSD